MSNETIKKKQYSIYLSSPVKEKIDFASSSQGIAFSEFMEKAALFYLGYLTAQEDDAFLPAAISEALKGQLEMTSAPTQRNLFKIAVELEKLSQLIAATVDAPEHFVQKLQQNAVAEVKKINGFLSYEKSGFYHQVNAPDKPSGGDKK